VVETNPDRHRENWHTNGTFGHRGPDPSEEAEHNEDLAVLEHAVHELDAEDGRLVELWKEGKQLAQIAKQLVRKDWIG
jgi:hypothetical protein